MSESTAFLTGDLAEALHGEMVPKFLATLDENGQPNVVLVASIDAADERTLYFGVFLLQKTRRNLERNPEVAVAVVTEELVIRTLRGRFRGFETSGPLVERVNDKPMFRYNSYMKISEVGLIDVEAVTGTWKLSKVAAAADVLPVKTRSTLPSVFASAWRSLGGRVASERLPPRVAEKFARTQALKVLAWAGGDGYPRVVPCLSLFPTASTTMIFGTRHIASQLAELPVGARVAANVVSLDPVSYQVKGVFEGGRGGVLGGGIARFTVDEVFSASPPLAGQRIPLIRDT